MTRPAVDDYAGIAEFHELFMDRPWERLRPIVRTAFGTLGARARILEIGAGSGRGTRVIAAESRAQITAYEPSTTMRTALAVSCMVEEDLRRRVTVCADGAPDIGRHAHVDGFVLAHMTGHLDGATRAATYRRLAQLAHPSTVGVITFAPESSSSAVELPAPQVREVGQHTYTCHYEDGPEPVAVYTVREKDRVIRSVESTSAWEPQPESLVRSELRDAGLSLRPLTSTAGLVTVMR